MVILVLDAVPRGLRGKLTRWMTEITTGVFIGVLSARVRGALWSHVIAHIENGRAILAWSTSNEQGYEFLTHNQADTKTIDLDGLKFIAKRDAAWLKAVKRFGLLPKE